MNIEWSKAPEGATGAMIAHFDGGETRRGDVEFIQNDEPCRSIYKEGPDAWVYHPAPAAPDWAGESLPPVGTVCEVYHCDQWLQGEVIAHFQQRAGMVAAYTVEVGSVGSDIKHLDCAIGECFRPTRTPEQIAAEERMHDVRNACSAIADTLDGLRGKTKVERAALAVVEAMIDAGYRKQEQTK